MHMQFLLQNAFLMHISMPNKESASVRIHAERFMHKEMVNFLVHKKLAKLFFIDYTKYKSYRPT